MRSIATMVAVTGLVVLGAPRQPDPGVAIAAERLVRERAESATRALDALGAAVGPGLDAARLAAAEVITGGGAPGPTLVAAGEAVAAAEPAAIEARRAVAALEGARSAFRPDALPVAEPIAAGELASIGAQLAAAAGAADDFADMRRRSLDLPTMLDRALAALVGGDLDAADAAVDDATATHELVAAWRQAPSTVPVWLATTGEMIAAVEDVIRASRAGDAAAAGEAADRFAAVSEDAATADRALRIALSEGGAAVTAVPLQRLADALRGLGTARRGVAAVAAGESRD